MNVAQECPICKQMVLIVDGRFIAHDAIDEGGQRCNASGRSYEEAWNLANPAETDDDMPEIVNPDSTI